MENNAYISKLLKELSEGSNEMAQQELKGMEYANPSLKNEREEIEHVWELAESYQSKISFDADAAFSKFKAEHISEVPTKNISAGPKVFVLRRRLVLSSIAASVALLIAGWFAFFSGETITNNSSLIQKHLLADGSVLHLMPDAEITLSSSFGEDNRRVELQSGIALFDVEKSSEPFEIDLGNSTIEVTGTLFSVKKDKNIIVNLFEGSIDYASHTGVMQVKAGQSLVHDSEHGVVTSNTVDNSLLDFIDNKLSFDKTPLDEVIARLESFYNVTINSKVDIPNDLHFTSTLLDQVSLQNILETLEISFNAEIQKVSETEYSIVSLSDVE